jgi:NarL family two-component system response regulator LiaR
MTIGAPQTDADPSKTAPIRTLLVEDDPVMLLGLQHLLEDLIVMDIGLPQLDGIEATRQIKLAMPELRIIMLTSHKTEHETVAALSSGADAYCIKGLNIAQLLRAIAIVQEGAIYLDPQVARRVLDHLQPTQRKAKDHSLSPRELEVLKLIVEGRSNPEIAENLYLSLSTVKSHIRSIMNKLAVDDRVQAAVIALRSGIV